MVFRRGRLAMEVVLIRWTFVGVICFLVACRVTEGGAEIRRTRRQVPGECFTVEGIPGRCSVPDECRFPPAVKVRLFRSGCVNREGRRGICCPGGTAAAATAAAAAANNNFNFQPTRPFFPPTTPRPRFPPQNDNGPFLFASPQPPPLLLPPPPPPPPPPSPPESVISLPVELPVDDLHTSCDESVNCLLTTDRSEPGPIQIDFQPTRPVVQSLPVPVPPTPINQRPVINTTIQFQQPNRNFINTNNINTNNNQPFFNNQQSFNNQPQLQLDPPSQQAIEQIGITNPPITDDCPEVPVCFPSKYRTFDGSCNNLNNPNWGKSFFAFPRLLPPVYADGLSVPRKATDGSELPSARLISSTLIADANVPDNFNTAMIMAYGQFLDHDLTRTAINKGKNNTGIACCRREMIENPSLRHAECLPIAIPTTDVFYSQFNQTCMEFVRSLAAPRPDCKFGPREQMNQITSYIDASNIYGSTKEESDDLRGFQGGRLQVSRVNDVDLLPFVTTKPDFCSKPDQGLFCFKAGDTRVNEQISLTVVHTIWLREHNRIAKELSRLNPNWSDQAIYQEARRIIGAMLQHITYNEFLPVLLGRRTMQTAELLLLRDGYSFDYNAGVNPSVTNEFATAAYRFGHTLIPGTFMLFNAQGQAEEVPLRQEFNRPFHLFKTGGLDSSLRGLCTQRSQQFDRFITQEVTNHLFERSRPFGLDLVAINLQRGRDHGLAGYNRWREFCGFRRINSFQELTAEMSPQYVQTLQQLYRSVDDIDLFVAGIAEKPLPGAKLGPTFACIVSDQFKRLKKGDRFWYENGQPSPFTPEQLQEIRKVTFARVICDNSDAIEQIQQFVFFAPARGNSQMPCQGNFIPRMNLNLWVGESV